MLNRVLRPGLAAVLVLLAARGLRADPLAAPVLLETFPPSLGERPPFELARVPGGAVIATQFNGAIHLQRRDILGAYAAGSFTSLAATGGRATSPAMAAYATGLWVVWTETPLTTGMPERALGLRVGFDLRPLDTAPVELARGARPTGLSCTATQCLLTFRDGFMRLSADGSRLDPSIRQVGAVSGPGLGRGSVVPLGDRFVVVWQGPVAGSDDDVYLARIAADGTVLDPGGRLFTAAGARRRIPALASDGSRLFVTWYADASGSRPQGQYAQLFDATLRPSAALAVVQGLPGSTYLGAWTGSQWLLWEPGGSGYLARFASDGTALDAAPFSRRLAGLSMLLGAGGDFEGLVADSARSSWTWGRYTSAGAPLGAASGVPLRYAIEREPYVDCDGNDFIVGWTEEGQPGPLRRVRPDGVGAALTREGGARLPFAPTAATLETDAVQLYGVVPGGGGSTARFTIASGSVGATTRLSNSLGIFRVVRGPGQRMAFFTQGQSRGGANELSRLDPAGARLDPNPIVLAGTRSVSAIFDGTNYLMVHPARSAGVLAAYARRMDQNGDFLDVVPRALALPGGLRYGPSLAFGAGTAMLAWVQSDGQVRAARLNPDGSLRDVLPTPLGLCTAEFFPELADREIALLFDGARFVAVWSADRGEGILARGVSPDGVVLDAQPLVVSAEGRVRVSTFAAAANRTGTTFVAYEHYDPSTGADRVLGARLQGGAVVVTDAGLRDVPTTSDVPTTDVPTTMDVPVALDRLPVSDQGASTEDLGADVLAMTDGASTPLDASVGLDLAPTADLAASDLPAPQDLVRFDDAPAMDAGTTPPAELGGCSVRGASAPGSASGWWWLLAAARVGRRRKRRARDPRRRDAP